MTTFTTRLLTPETWDDFSALVEVNNGVWGGWWCMGFHPEGFSAGSREGNRLAKLQHVERGTVHQVLVYDGEECVGWCQRKPQRGAYLQTGPEELYAEFGFERDRRIAKWRWVMRRTV